MAEPRKGWVHHGRPNFIDKADEDEEVPEDKEAPDQTEKQH